MRPRDRLLLVLGSLLGSTACSESSSDPEPKDPPPAADAPEPDAEPETPEPETPEPEAPPPSGHAVAKVGALLFTSSTGEVGFELPPLGEGPAAAPGMTVNVVGTADGRLAVETLVAQPTEHHCSAVLEGLADFRLRLYLSADDLLPVLIDDFEHEYEDGTRVRVARGVPVRGGAAEPELLARGTIAHAPVDEDQLGSYYEPGTAFPTTDPKGVVPSLEGHPLAYGTHSIDDERLSRDGDALSHFGAVARSDDYLVTLRNPCLEVVARVSKERMLHSPVVGLGTAAGVGSSAGIIGTLGEAEDGHFLASPYGGAFAVGSDDEDVWGGLTGTEVGEAFGVGGLGLVGTGRGGGGTGESTTYEVKAGTSVLWADGTQAGQVISDHGFDQAPRDHEGRSCFDVTLSPAHALTLCFAPGDVGQHTVAAGTIGLGSTGLIGKGGGGGTGSGYGRGSGAGFGGRGKRVPRVRASKATVKGALDKDIIRRIVRAHINEVRYCYNQGLVRDPSLKGKVSIQFTIGPTGKVPAAVVASHTLADEKVANCIAKAVKRWKFPKPTGGGNVVVTYPFTLEPG